MTIAEFEQTIHTLFGRHILERFSEEWGLTTRGREPVTHIGYATNLTPETTIAAREAGVELLITHHDAWPFLYGMKEACLLSLQEAGVSHFFIHLPLDDAEFGTSASLAERLGGHIIGRTHSYKDLLAVGRIVEFQPHIPFSELVQRTENALDESVRGWQHHDRPVSRLCIAAGGGGITTHVKEAVDQACDTYLTGEKSLYTVEYARFAGINLIIGSHTFTEIYGVEGLIKQLVRHHPSLTAIRITEAHIE